MDLVWIQMETVWKDYFQWEYQENVDLDKLSDINELVLIYRYDGNAVSFLKTYF